MFELQQTESGVHFTHLAVNTGGNNGDLIDKTEVFQVVDALLSLGIRANYCTTFEGIKHLSGMKTQHTKVAVTQDAAACIFYAKGMSSIVNHP
ncbi:hypothetical protein D9M71_631960 [compost metagenome]